MEMDPPQMETPVVIWPVMVTKQKHVVDQIVSLSTKIADLARTLQTQANLENVV